MASVNPRGKTAFQGRPEEIPKKRPDVLRTSLYGPICNAMGSIRSGMSLGRIQDVMKCNVNLIKVGKKSHFTIICNT